MLDWTYMSINHRMLSMIVLTLIAILEYVTICIIYRTEDVDFRWCIHSEVEFLVQPGNWYGFLIWICLSFKILNLFGMLSSWGSSNYRPSAPFLYEVASHVKNCHFGDYYNDQPQAFCQPTQLRCYPLDTYWCGYVYDANKPPMSMSTSMSCYQICKYPKI